MEDPCGHQSQGAGPAGVSSLAPRGCSFPGLSHRLKHTLRIAVIAVVFAVVSAWGLIIPVCQSEKLRISELGGAGPHFPCLIGESKEHCSGNPHVLGYPTASGWGWAAPHHEEGVTADTGFPGLTAVTPLCSGFLGGELWRWLSSYTCGLVCIACILDGTAGILWMWEEGQRGLWGGLEGGRCRVQWGPERKVVRDRGVMPWNVEDRPVQSNT